jgi:hypothetical protein
VWLILKHLKIYNTCLSTLRRIIHLTPIQTYLAVPMPCHAAKGLDCVFPILFTQCGHVWFTHAMLRPFRARVMPRSCRSESDFSRPRYSAAWNGMCELTSAVQRRHVDDLPAFGFFRLSRGVSRRLLTEAYQSVNLLDWQFGYFRLPRGLSRRTRYCRRMAGARHGMCELTRHGMAGERRERGMACVN